MKITPEQYKAVQSYVDYITNLYSKPQALPPPKSKINKRTKSGSNTKDQEFFVDSNGVITPVNTTTQRINNSLPHPNTRRLPPSPNAAQNTKNIQNNPFYKSVSSWVTDNPKTSYSAIASLFAAPILYSMFGGSEDTSSGTVPKGTNADTNNYKLLANKAKQDINKEYAAARNSTTGNNIVTNTQSATQNADNNLKQLNELDTRIDANMAKSKALEAETLRRIQEQQANQKSPQNPQSGSVWDTGSADNGTNNLAENVVNTSVGQDLAQGATTPEIKEKPVTGTNKGTGNVLVDSVKKKVNQDTKKNVNTGNTVKLNNSAIGKVATEYVPYTPVEIPGFSAEEYIKDNPEFAIPKQTFSNNTGSAKVDVKPETNQSVLTPEQIENYYATQGAKKSVPNPKTALTEPQRDYYRYLTGYHRMDPNQAILSMGLDPNKYYY